MGASTPPGTDVTLTVLCDGRPSEVQATLDEYIAERRSRGPIRREAMESDQSRETPGAEAPETDEMPEEEVYETLAESFPASDPPSWTLGTDHRSASSDEPPPDDASSQ